MLLIFSIFMLIFHQYKFLKSYFLKREDIVVEINLPQFHRGKVRQTYFIPGYQCLLLLVATDRLSTHNVVHKTTVPLKGQVLTALTVFWIQKILEPNKIPHHIVAYGKNIYDFLPKNKNYPDDLHLCAFVVIRLEMVPVEFIWRHYLTGSLYKNYYNKKLENPYGIYLPNGLQNMSFFERPIFTPTNKSENDEPLSAENIISRHCDEVLLTGKIYRLCREYALTKGIEIIDTKLECGKGIVGDEIVTPDSSRFTKTNITKGIDSPWLDKEIFRQDAEKQWGAGPKAPLEFSGDVIDKGMRAYLELFEVITDIPLVDFQEKYF